MNPLYISATLQDCGKTCVTLGLMQILKEKYINTGYIKPVGQHYIDFHGHDLDEDAVLVYEYFDLKDDPADLSPIAVRRGFTRDFILNPNVGPLEKKIEDSIARLHKNYNLLLVEGTGHAGVGSCFGLSNARVAKITKSKAIIVTSGGIGKPLDEVYLSLSVFRDHGVDVLGVILNKVHPDKYDKVNETVSKGLELMGTKLLGSIPYERSMTTYSFGQVAQEFSYEILCGHELLDENIEHVIVAAMEPQNVLSHAMPNSLIITPGDRIDNILLALSLANSTDFHDKVLNCGLILTGGLWPDQTILNLLKKSRIPVLTTVEDTFTVTSRMKDLEFKIQLNEKGKIERARDLVLQHVDIEAILDMLA